MDWAAESSQGWRDGGRLEDYWHQGRNKWAAARGGSVGRVSGRRLAAMRIWAPLSGGEKFGGG